MSPNIERALDRVTMAILPPGQSTPQERRLLRDELFKLVQHVLESADLRAQERVLERTGFPAIRA